MRILPSAIVITSLAALATPALWLGAAFAQDEGESKGDDGGTEEPESGGINVDDIMKSIDLGPEAQGEDGYVAEKTYEGQLSQVAPSYKPGTPISISHSGGTVTVRCQQQDGVTARLGYVIYGTNGANMERMGKGIGLSATASSTSGAISTRIPAKSSGVTRSEIPLTVNLPPKANVSVTGGAGWVQVDGCEGTVKVSNSKDGVVITGTHSAVNVSSGGGDVKVHLTDASSLKGSSAISSKGAIDLELPTTFDGKFSAKGKMVRVFHTVNGTNTNENVSGTVGSGSTATLNLTATGDINVTAPK
jgi:hypothetical protein